MNGSPPPLILNMKLDVISLILLFPIFIFIFIYCFFFPKSKSTTQIGFKNYPILGTLPEFLLNRHRFLEWSTQVLSHCPTNTAVFRRPGNIHGIITANPANVEYMLKTNFDNYPKGTRFISLLQDFLGRGIFNSDGEAWRAQRKTASYEFNTRSLRNFVMETATVELHTRFIPILETAADLDQVIDFQELLERYSFDNICKVAFNVDPGCLAGDGNSGSEFMAAFEDAATLSSGRFMYAFPGLYKIKKLFNFGSESKLQKSISTVHKFAGHIIASRMEGRAKNPDEDLLSRFMGISEYSPEFLRDVVISFILAGRDTTSSALAWFFWILSSHPKVEQKILDELKTIRLSSGKDRREFYSFDELRQMHYLHAAISEGLRLYPPVPVDTKACLKNDVMPDGTFVGEGWFVTYHTYAMGRMESVWGADCREFRPERWLEEEESGGGKVVYRPENPFKFPVFHGGPRICLGKEMAYTQMKLVAAAIIEKFKVEVVVTAEEKNPPEHVLSLTMRMKDGLRVRVRKR
ncbi:cytochrome P450 94A1-like [Cynara cardunculus var. scolymus]|uniref:cytochrome P450 94A1-like n=1 Tax=Cynara cardunculus var. scolymus TaxID=59895 RepID=UPI000D628DDA|nr:cytochrome P450 94A1-like [Cynara cardunculus var. scolymus]